MNSRLLASHLGVALLAFGLGYLVFSGFSSGDGASGPGDRPSDPVAAFAEALAIEEPHARTRALLDFFAVADPAWAERLRAEVNNPGSPILLDEIAETLFASWWARTDPKAAFENVANPGWPNRHPWIRYVMRAWVVADPVRAAEAVASLPPNPDRGQLEAMREVVEHWWDAPTSVDPAPLIAMIHKLPVVSRAASIQRLIEASIAHRGIDATEQWIEALPKEEAFGVSVQQEMLARFGQSLIDHDMGRAVRWAQEHGAGREGSGILRHMAFTWGAKNGPAAMEWGMTLPDARERGGVLMRAWLSFRNAEPEKAAEWLEAREPDEILEAIFQRYLSGTAGLDANKALEIANRTKDPKIRERLLAAVGRGWMKTDPDAARKWLDTVELAPELEKQVRESVPFDPTKEPSLAPAANG